jgi:hypothetical protein
MPTYQRITEAREKSRRIREVHSAFKREQIKREEALTDIRQALRSASASEFILAEVL